VGSLIFSSNEDKFEEEEQQISHVINREILKLIIAWISRLVMIQLS
jgi:hypothetical protein